MSVVERLKKMLVEQLNLNLRSEQIADDEPLFKGGLELDSVDTLEIIVGIEREFNLKINRKKVKKPAAVFKTVASLAAFVEKLLAKK